MDSKRSSFDGLSLRGKLSVLSLGYGMMVRRKWEHAWGVLSAIIAVGLGIWAVASGCWPAGDAGWQDVWDPVLLVGCVFISVGFGCVFGLAMQDLEKKGWARKGLWIAFLLAAGLWAGERAANRQGILADVKAKELKAQRLFEADHADGGGDRSEWVRTLSGLEAFGGAIVSAGHSSPSDGDAAYEFKRSLVEGKHDRGWAQEAWNWAMKRQRRAMVSEPPLYAMCAWIAMGVCFLLVVCFLDWARVAAADAVSNAFRRGWISRISVDLASGFSGLVQDVALGLGGAVHFVARAPSHAKKMLGRAGDGLVDLALSEEGVLARIEAEELDKSAERAKKPSSPRARL
jgi:hypothetical protein